MWRHNLRQHSIETHTFDGVSIEVDCVEDGEDSYYELYHYNDCINLGNPFYEKPTRAQIENFLSVNKIWTKDLY